MSNSNTVTHTRVPQSSTLVVGDFGGESSDDCYYQFPFGTDFRSSNMVALTAVRDLKASIVHFPPSSAVSIPEGKENRVPLGDRSVSPLTLPTSELSRHVTQSEPTQTRMLSSVERQYSSGVMARRRLLTARMSTDTHSKQPRLLDYIPPPSLFHATPSSSYVSSIHSPLYTASPSVGATDWDDATSDSESVANCHNAGCSPPSDDEYEPAQQLKSFGRSNSSESSSSGKPSTPMVAVPRSSSIPISPAQYKRLPSVGTLQHKVRLSSMGDIEQRGSVWLPSTPNDTTDDCLWDLEM